MSNLSTLVFSYRRAFQLKEYLRSLFLTCKEAPKVSVLYKDEPEFSKSYDKVKEEFPQVTFHKEEDFAQQLKTLMSQISTEYFSFGVDDVLFYRNWSMETVVRAFSEYPKQTYGFSLRLHPGVAFCHPANTYFPTPGLVQVNDFYLWDSATALMDWAYNFELCATIYKSQTAQEMVNQIEKVFPIDGISHPNHLEGKGSLLVHADKRKIMACPLEATASVITCNRVQSIYENPIYENENLYSPGAMDKLLWDGSQFDLEKYATGAWNSIHIGEIYLK